MGKRVTAIDLLADLDGELAEDEAREVVAALGEDDALKAKAESLGQLGEVVQTYAELEADDATPALDGLWERIDRRVHANGEADEPAAPAARPAPRSGWWTRFGEWLDEVRGYVLTGSVAAGAAAALVLLLQSGGAGQTPKRLAERAPLAPMPTRPVALESQPPEVEELEVYGGSGSVLTIPEKEGKGGTAVIWLSRDENYVEGPI